MFRSSYWSSSALSKWIRTKFGLSNPVSLTHEGWNEWRKQCKQISPFIHWLTETAFNKIQKVVYWPIDMIWDIRCAIKSRFFEKSHYLHTKLDPWAYHEIDHRMLHGMFETLVDFVEIEKAWMNVIWGQDDNRVKFGYKWYETNRWINWFLSDRRHPESGLDHLNWEMSLIKNEDWFGCDEEAIQKAKETGIFNTLTPQALAAKEQFELYHWWKHIRPNRPDPHDASGYADYFKKLEEKHNGDFLAGLGDQSPELAEEGRVCGKRHLEIEEAYEKEDTDMLIRLVKIRKSLWT